MRRTSAWPVRLGVSIAVLALAIPLPVALAAGPAVSAAPALTSGSHWHALNLTTAPNASDSGGMTYDGADHLVVLFGGNGASGLSNETWTFASGTWTHLNGTGAPSARRGVAMAYDPAIGRVVLFGGAAPNTGMGDTWTFRHGVWKQIFPSTSPPARAGASIVYDPITKALLMFGGTSDYCCSNAGLGDFWEFAPNSTWVQLSPTTLPSQRNAYALTWDGTLKEAVLFGGWQPGGSCGAVLGDSWAYQNGTWSSVTTASGMTARQGPSLAWSPKTGAVLFGGWTGSCGTSQVPHNDTFHYWASGWARAGHTVGPSARAWAYFCYDYRDGYLLLFGGQGKAGDIGDTWTFR